MTRQARYAIPGSVGAVDWRIPGCFCGSSDRKEYHDSRGMYRRISFVARGYLRTGSTGLFVGKGTQPYFGIPWRILGTVSYGVMPRLVERGVSRCETKVLRQRRSFPAGLAPFQKKALHCFRRNCRILISRCLANLGSHNQPPPQPESAERHDRNHPHYDSKPRWS